MVIWPYLFNLSLKKQQKKPTQEKERKNKSEKGTCIEMANDMALLIIAYKIERKSK